MVPLSGWGYKLLNGLSITSGGRWLVPFLTESDPDSHSTVLLSLVSRPTGGFVLVCEWQMGEWVKTAHWGWTCEAGRERQTSPNYIQDSRFDGTQINLLWHSPVRTERIIYNGVILWQIPTVIMWKMKKKKPKNTKEYKTLSSGYCWWSRNWYKELGGA